MSPKKRRGRPLGGKNPPEVRKVWREYQRQRRAEKKKRHLERYQE